MKFMTTRQPLQAISKIINVNKADSASDYSVNDEQEKPTLDSCHLNVRSIVYNNKRHLTLTSLATHVCLPILLSFTGWPR